MREFFKGWRRKVGCALLLMACVFMVAWVQNRFYADHAQIVITGASNISALSMYDSIQIVYRRLENPLGPRPDTFLFSTSPVTPDKRGIWDPWKLDNAPYSTV